jgi:CBS domain containing-hemolysin-like protein
MPGSPGPVPAGIIVEVLPFAWVFLTLEYIESLWVLMLIVFLILYFGPVFPKSKAADTPQS